MHRRNNLHIQGKARVIPRGITMIKRGMQWSNWPLVGELAKVDKTRM